MNNYRPTWQELKPWLLVWLLGILMAAAFLLGIVWYVLFRANTFSVEVRLQGEQSLIMEYGETYTEPGAAAYLKGTRFLKEGKFLPETTVSVSGKIPGKTLGKVQLTYRARYRGLEGTATREILVLDTQCPVIELEPIPDGEFPPGSPFEEPGYKATDNYDGDITERIVRTAEAGIITYAVTDSSGNPAVVQREVPWYDPTAPEIILEGEQQLRLTVGTPYEEPGFRAMDSIDGDVTQFVQVQGEVDWLTPGEYPITYTVTDSYGNTASLRRTVLVTAKTWPDTVWPEEKTIYLTFDDGPGPHTGRLLDILDAYGAKATFFVVDSEEYDLMRRIVRRGHTIGIHSVTHDYREIYSNPEAYFADLKGMQEIIYRETGVLTSLMRFPGGSSNEVSPAGMMETLKRAVQDAGFQYFDWNVDSDDAGSARKWKTVRDNVIEGVQKNGTSIVLQHDIHGYSVDAVESILQWGSRNGYCFRALRHDSPGFHHEDFF